MNQQLEGRKETKQSQVFNTEVHGAGCGLDRVWIGLDPGLDRPGTDFFVYVAAWMQCDKKRTTR